MAGAGRIRRWWWSIASCLHAAYDPTARPIPLSRGYLSVGDQPDAYVDLEWTRNLFVVGALASLNVGPGGGNIMGAR